MPECHKCKHDGKASKACLKCAGPNDSGHHVHANHVNIDRIQIGVRHMRDHDADGSDTTQRHEAMLRFLAAWSASSPKCQAVFSMQLLHPGLSFADIGRKLHMKPQAVSNAIRRGPLMTLYRLTGATPLGTLTGVDPVQVREARPVRNSEPHTQR